MANASLNEFQNRCVDYAKSTYRSNPELDGSMLLIAEFKDPSLNGMWQLVFEDADEKNMLFIVSSFMLKRQGAERYAILSMAWRASQTMDELRDKGIITPSEDPNREECMIVACADLDGNRDCSIWNVVRENNAIKDFTEDGVRGNGDFGTPIFNLLNPGKSTPPDHVLDSSVKMMDDLRIYRNDKPKSSYN